MKIDDDILFSRKVSNRYYKIRKNQFEKYKKQWLSLQLLW